MFRMLVYILVLLTVSDGALLSDETLSQCFLQLYMLKMLLYILVLQTVSGALCQMRRSSSCI